MANTGRTNLLEEVGRIDAEPMNPNRMAEKSRVLGELNRGYKKGGVLKAQKGVFAGKLPHMKKVKPGSDQAFTLQKGVSAAPIMQVKVKIKPKTLKQVKKPEMLSKTDIAIGAGVTGAVAEKKLGLYDKAKKIIKKITTKEKDKKGPSRRGRTTGGVAPQKAKGGVAKKQGGGEMFSRGYGVGEPSRRTPTALLDRGPAYKKGGVIKAESGIMATKAAQAYKLAKARKSSGRLNIDDLKRARRGEDPTASTARERAIADQHKKKTKRKTLTEILKPKASVAGPHRDIVGKRRVAKLFNAKGGGIAKRGLGIIKKG
jgi:hypothetical protein